MLGVRKSLQLVKKLSAAKCRWFAYGPADTGTLLSLASLKSSMVYLSGAGLPSLLLLL